MYNRHGQSAALKLIFAALGPFLLLGKANYLSLLTQIWAKMYKPNLNKHQQRPKNNLLCNFEKCGPK